MHAPVPDPVPRGAGKASMRDARGLRKPFRRAVMRVGGQLGLLLAGRGHGRCHARGTVGRSKRGRCNTDLHPLWGELLLHPGHRYLHQAWPPHSDFASMPPECARRSIPRRAGFRHDLPSSGSARARFQLVAIFRRKTGRHAAFTSAGLLLNRRSPDTSRRSPALARIERRAVAFTITSILYHDRNLASLQTRHVDPVGMRAMGVASVDGY